DLRPERVHGGCVAELLGQERQHGIDDFRIDAGGGIVVEVNRSHETHPFPWPVTGMPRRGVPSLAISLSCIPPMVTLAAWQPTQARDSFTSTRSPSTSTSSQSPPSAFR